MVASTIIKKTIDKLGSQKWLFFSIIKNPLFLVVLVLKIIASTLFLSDIPATLFVPFLSFFAENPGGILYHFK